MKVLHLSSENSWRGGEQQIAYLVKEHLNSGVEIFVASKINSPFSTFCMEEKIPLFELNFNGSFDLKTAKEIAKICRSNNIDIIHAHSGNSHSLAVLSHLFFGAKKSQIVLSRRVDFPIKKNPWAKWKYNHKSIRKIVCVSDAIKNILSPDITKKDKLVTVHSGIDLKKFESFSNTNFLRKKYDIPAEFLLVGNTSAIAPHKDYFTFVDTCSLLKKKNLQAKYFIIGTGPEEEKIKNYVKKKSLENDIIFTGFLDNIQEALPELDVFLITSETEGLGTSLLDSFASKVPVVATEAGGIPELILHEKTGLLCPIKNPEKLAEAVLRMTCDKALKKTVVEGALIHLENFSKKKTAEKTFAVYKNILDN